MSDEKQANDPILRPLIEATSESNRKDETDILVSTYALPVIDRVLAARLRRSSLDLGGIKEDLRADVIVKLLNRLERLAVEGDVSPIRSFVDYVAVATYHTFDDFMRQSYPVRASVYHKVRYLLTHDAKFAMWDVEQKQFCGLASWRSRVDGLSSADDVELPRTSGRSEDLRKVLVEAFTALSQPIELSPLVTMVMGSWDAVEVLPEIEPGDRVDPLARLENIEVLRFLWSEIRQLPSRQRIALLLNLRDAEGDSVARLLPLTGVASIDQIAETLDIPDFSGIWARMPLDDLNIAGLLQVTRQQVINLRKSARERLARRMARIYE